MTQELSELLREINAWQDKVFPQATARSALAHLRREVVELTCALDNKDFASAAPEMADIFILLAGAAHLTGIDLEDAVREKMKINAARKWGEPDHEGVIEHIEPEEVLTPAWKIRMNLDNELPT